MMKAIAQSGMSYLFRDDDTPKGKVLLYLHPMTNQGLQDVEKVTKFAAWGDVMRPPSADVISFMGGATELKDVYGGIDGTRLGRRNQHEGAVQRAKRIKVRAHRVCLARNSTSLKEHALMLQQKAAQDGDGDGWVDDGKPTMRPAPKPTSLHTVNLISREQLSNPDTPRTRAVSADEFKRLAAEGKQQLWQLRQDASPPTGLYRRLNILKREAWESTREEWGGMTIDAHTGMPLTGNEKKYALTVKPPGATSVSVPITASQDEFEEALQEALRKWKSELRNQQHYLGIFRDEDSDRIDFDPVLVVDSVDEVERIGSFTGAVGGAYCFADGNGYWPPYVGAATKARKNDSDFKGPGQWRSQAVRAREQFLKGKPESKALPKDGDGDGLIFDGTPRQRPAPIGTPVVGDLSYGGIYPAGGVPKNTFQIVEDSHGDRYVVGPDLDIDDDLRFVAVVEQADIENFWDDIAVQDAASRVEALKLLDAITRSKRKAGAKTIIGSKGSNPTKINIPKRSSAEREADAEATRAAQEAAKKKPAGKQPTASARASQAAKKAAAKAPAAKKATTTAKKPTAKARATAAAKPKEKKIPAWQRDWNDLTKQEQKDIIAQRGVPSKVNPLTKQEWTPDAIVTKRNSNLNKGEKSLADVVKRVQNTPGWRLVTDDRERWGLSMKVGKSMPPNWSHVFVYEGPDADQRKYTVQGLDWAWKVQPHQPPEKREESLGNKMGRYRALTKKLPLLDRQTKKDAATGNHVATAVRLLMLSGGRVDSGGGENVTGSRGITSLQARDVIVKGNIVSLNFDAKSGHKNDYRVNDKVIADEMKTLLRDKGPEDRVFPKTVNSGSTGKYLKSVVGDDFTNHDLRTAVANIAANKAIGEWIRGGGVVHLDNEKSVRTEVMSIAARVGELINDTPGTAYNSYIDPAVFSQMGIPENLLPKRGAK